MTQSTTQGHNNLQRSCLSMHITKSMSERLKNVQLVRTLTFKIKLAICSRAFSASVTFSSLSFELIMITRSSCLCSKGKHGIGYGKHQLV